VAEEPSTSGTSASSESIERAEAPVPEFSDLRKLLLGEEQARIAELERRLDEIGITPEELAEHLPAAVAARTAQDQQLARSLAPTLQEAFGESVQRNPQQIAHAIFPIMGPAIRKAIAETMAGLVNTLNRAIEHSLSWRGLKWRIEAWRTGAPYAQIVIKHALVYRVEQVFLIHRETGLLLANAAAADLETQDADLISGMLTAIRDFVQDSFGTSTEGDGGLRTFSVGERTVLVEQGPRALLAAVVSGQPPASLLERVQATLETLHLQFGSVLARFDGDTAPFETAQPLLDELLETVLTTDRPSTRGRAPRIAWAAILIGLALLAGLWIRSTVRWNRAVTALAAEPGIVLIEVERGLRTSRLVGLVDPLATDPGRLLNRMSIDTSRVETQWQSFLSFEPEIVTERARQATNAPSGVAFELMRDTLFATGTAAFDWVQRTRTASALLPGVSHIDVSRVEPTLPNDLAVLKQEIEDQRILFEIGSAALVSPADDLIAGIATGIREMLTIGGDRGYEVSVELIGRSDTTGTNETNRVLSLQRANVVRASLATLGVPRPLLRATGRGTSDPIPSSDPDTRAAVNRSVSFSISVTYAIGSGRN
jgi:OOP family OmpA-OmpF porin